MDSPNWNKHTMCVQDLIDPDVNVTAGIPKNVAHNFQEMCEIFSKKMAK